MDIQTWKITSSAIWEQVLRDGIPDHCFQCSAQILKLFEKTGGESRPMRKKTK